MRPLQATALTFSSLFLALPALPALAAVHAHADDIHAKVESGELIVEHPPYIDLRTGYSLFEGDFGDFHGGPNLTRNPGYEVHHLLAGSVLAAQAVGSLQFWNGSGWGAATSATSLSLSDVLGNSVSWNSSGNNGVPGLLGQAAADGEVHGHVDFSLSAGAPIGAYLVSFALLNLATLPDSPAEPDFSNPLLPASNPISIAFNFGLGHEAFEAAVDARVVPVPAAAWLLGTGLVGLASSARQRRGNPA